ncbi:DUF779 domain-containing protein (plasmid) [Mycolicibacterium fluoranthenivorans]|uniref:DUF779 domain-containing protein n=1 Tax=Mycolicibacterium fluoranthenivorans TaxID=258505 RepID=A0A7G8PQ73_9MYCO|nr:DUF779 domain-containing protein [Mycolicibacterium fluoranthenivorans]QNJ96489.1 DUF779 domain-containing protein [Mycolicibacterium fluoranthenivorans]
MPAAPDVVDITPQAAQVLQRLIAVHGPVMFHQSGGCCDGSAPMCYPQGEFRTGESDVMLGHLLDETPFWISADQYHSQRGVAIFRHAGRERGRVQRDACSYVLRGDIPVGGRR